MNRSIRFSASHTNVRRTHRARSLRSISGPYTLDLSIRRENATDLINRKISPTLQSEQESTVVLFTIAGSGNVVVFG
jgi:hypothetical protein